MRHPLPHRIHDRQSAGHQLSQQLQAYRDHPDAIVLGVPRGGVPIAYEVATALNLPMDVCLVRKLGVPHHRELAMGAIAANGVRILNYEIIAWEGISSHAIDEVTTKELRELQRRDHAYRGNRPFPNLKNKIVILVDDGVATGSSIRAAIALLRQQDPAKIVLAVPVIAPTVNQTLKAEVDQIVSLLQPEPLYAIGKWYENFAQVSDEEVCQLLEQATVAPTDPAFTPQPI